MRFHAVLLKRNFIRPEVITQTIHWLAIVSIMKKTFIAIGAVVVLTAGFLALNSYIYNEKQADLPAESVSAFETELTTRGVQRVGQPIEGFDAFSLLSAFSGLEEADFAGVETFEGVYRYIDNELTYERTSDQAITSAEQTVATAGYTTLLRNVSARLNMSTADTEAVQMIVDMLVEGGVVEGEAITANGQITCLPKLGDGAQTMECAIGLESESGDYYSLKTPADAGIDYEFLGSGTTVEVRGMLTNEEQYGPDGNRYDTVGTITIEAIGAH